MWVFSRALPAGQICPEDIEVCFAILTDIARQCHGGRVAYLTRQTLDFIAQRQAWSAAAKQASQESFQTPCQAGKIRANVTS